MTFEDIPAETFQKGKADFDSKRRVNEKNPSWVSIIEAEKVYVLERLLAGYPGLANINELKVLTTTEVSAFLLANYASLGENVFGLKGKIRNTTY